MESLRSGIPILAVLSCAAFAADNPQGIITASPVHSRIIIDGVIEPAWLAATPAEGFIQREPDEGTPVSFPTRVYALFDRDALYFAFDCRDPAPDSIRAPLKKRESTSDADAVGVYLDTFHNLRNGYYFVVSAGGVQNDGAISDVDEFDYSWDGIWKSAVAIHDSGWSAEMRIPFQSFRHGGARADGWGINFKRFIFRLNQEAHWQPVERPHGMRTDNFGIMLGLQDIKSSAHVEILPHLVGTWTAPDAGKYVSDIRADNAGLDLKVVPEASWTLDLTYQPDFAQVDVDRQVVNLYPYPVYLSEKRPFFLEGLDLFANAPQELLYTRRITDPDYGARVTGKWGKVRGTALQALNRTSDGQPENTAATRVEYDLGERSNLGLTVTYLNRESYRAAATSIDGVLRWGKWNSLELSLAGVDRSVKDTRPLAGGFDLIMSEGLWRAGYELTWRGLDYDANDLGWSSYSNYLEHWIFANYRIYPDRGLIRYALSGINLDYTSLESGAAPGWDVSVLTNVESRNYWSLMFWPSWGSSQWRSYTDAESGAYRDNFGWFNTEKHTVRTYYVVLSSDTRQDITSSTFWYQTSFYEGTMMNTSQEFVVKPWERFWGAVELNWTRVWGVSDINNGAATDYRIWYLKGRYSPSLNTSLRGTLQWVEHSDWLGVNLVYAWNWQPGSWLYLVYNEERGIEDMVKSHPGDRTIHFKWTYFVSLP